MTSDEFQNMVIQHFQKVYEKLDSIEKRQTKLETHMENKVVDKIKILFDANQIQKDRHKELMERFGNIEERLDSIEIDTGYLVSRVARLEKVAK